MKITIRRRDPVIVVLAILATLVGLLFIFDAGYARSIQKTGSPLPGEFRMQVLYLLGSLVIYGIAANVPLNWYQRAAPWLWAATLVSLALVDVIGHEQNEAKRWIKLGPITFQPSEFAKLTVILMLAAVFATRDKWKPKPWRDWSEYMDRNFSPKIKRSWPWWAALAGVVLIEGGKDLGTAAILLLIILTMFVAGGVSWKSMLLIGLFLSTATLAVVYKQPYRVERIRNHFVRWNKNVVDDVGFQTTQAERGGAEGRGLGHGIGNGQVKQIIPAPTTDFIMATIAEETGLLGSAVVIALLGGICARLLALSLRAPDRFGALILVGSAGWIGVQTCTNVMMANATLPAIGIPIPFISSGGSSLIALWLMLGVSQSALVGFREEREVTHANRPHRWWHRRSRLSRA